MIIVTGSILAKSDTKDKLLLLSLEHCGVHVPSRVAFFMVCIKIAKIHCALCSLKSGLIGTRSRHILLCLLPALL